mgnify:CR=1 FL=1
MACSCSFVGGGVSAGLLNLIRSELCVCVERLARKCHTERITAGLIAPRRGAHQVHPHDIVAFHRQHAAEFVARGAADEHRRLAARRQDVEIVLTVGCLHRHR